MLTSRAISEFTGIPERTITDWKNRQIIPETSDINLITKSIIAYLKGQIENLRSKSSGKDVLYEEKTRLTKAQADKIELENAQAEGLLVEAAQVEMVWKNLILACKSRFLAIPIKISFEIAEINDPILVQSILESEIYEALIELSNSEVEEPTDNNGNREQSD